MRKYLLAVWLTTCISSVTLTSRVFAADQTQSEPPKVTLYGAGSLRGSLSEVADTFTQEYGINVNREFGPSGSLRERLENGEKTDVFASADIGNPLKLYQLRLSGPVVNFTSNPLYAIASPRVSLTTDNLLDQFLNPNVKLGIAQPVRDPLGDYAIEIFRKADQIKPGSFELLDAKAVRFTGPLPPERNSPGGSIVYYLEEAQQADIYPVYYTSALSALELSPNLQVVELPDNLAVKADYGLTVLKNASPNGTKLAEYILSPAGQRILAKYGFSSPSSTRSTSVGESHNLGGIILAVGIALILKKTSASSKKRKLQKAVTCCHYKRIFNNS